MQPDSLRLLGMWKTTVEPAKPRKSVRFLPVVRVLAMPDDPATARRLVFETSEVPVGRAVGERGLAFPEDDAVSRQHAVLRFDAASRSASIEDTSRSGTFVQGQRTSNNPVREGDVVRVGNSFFLFRFEPEDELGDGRTESELGADWRFAGALERFAARCPWWRRARPPCWSWANRALEKSSLRRCCTPKAAARVRSWQSIAARFPRRSPRVSCSATCPARSPARNAKRSGGSRPRRPERLFLDELGELPLALQPKLLRAVEERAVVPVGATRPYRATFESSPPPTATSAIARGSAEISWPASPSSWWRFRRSATGERTSCRFSRACWAHARAELDPELLSALLLYDFPHNARDLRRDRHAAFGARRKPRALGALTGRSAGRAARPTKTRPTHPRSLQVLTAAPAPIPSRDELVELLKRACR